MPCLGLLLLLLAYHWMAKGAAAKKLQPLLCHLTIAGCMLLLLLLAMAATDCDGCS
jgi:hypothetical protein